MKYAINLLFIFCLTPFAGLAQTDEFSEEKTLVNQIKRNNEYIYADKLDETKTGAIELAQTILEIEVNRIIADEQITEPTAEIIAENLKNRVHIIELKRGELFRAFVYITREELFSGAQPTTTENAPEEQIILVEETLMIEENSEEELVIEESAEEELVIAEGTEAVNSSAESKPTNLQTRNAILDEMIRFTTVQDIQPYLARKKQEGNVMYGTLESLPNRSVAYLIIYDKNGAIVAILDKGGDPRLNLMNGKENDRLENYPNTKVVWVQIFNK